MFMHILYSYSFSLFVSRWRWTNRKLLEHISTFVWSNVAQQQRLNSFTIISGLKMTDGQRTVTSQKCLLNDHIFTLHAGHFDRSHSFIILFAHLSTPKFSCIWLTLPHDNFPKSAVETNTLTMRVNNCEGNLIIWSFWFSKTMCVHSDRSKTKLKRGWPVNLTGSISTVFLSPDIVCFLC